MVLLSISVSSPFFFFPHFKPQSEKEDGPVTAAKFYGAVAPAISLKIMQGPRPSLKEAFSATASNEQTQQQIPKKICAERSAQLILAVLMLLSHKNLSRELSIAETINPNKCLSNQ